MPGKVERRLEAEQLIKGYCLMDDAYMTAFFKDDIKSTELILRILLKKDDLKVNKVTVQDAFKNLKGHSATMDVVAVDSTGKVYNIEVQNAVSEAHPKRARYYSSLLDANLLPKGTDFETLPDTYVIFITKADRFQKDRMMYHFMRKDDIEYLNDGSHIIYVNAENRDDSAIGKLMQDFICTNPEEMCYDELREKSLEFKGSEKGAKTMDKITERLIELKVEDKIEELVENFLKNSDLSIEEIAKNFNLPVEQVQALAEELNNE